MEAFNDIFEDCTSLGTKIPKDEYLTEGKHIVVDQGQNDISGYTDLENGLFEDVPAIIFGDHTRIIKYVDEPFFLGADGVKLLKAKSKDANYKYLYYALRNAKIPDTGYNRHFKWLKEVNIEYPNPDKQQEIAEILDRISKVIEERNLELQHLDELIKARFVEMFGDPVHNEKEWNIKSLKDVCTKLNDGTHFSPESYENGDYKYVTAKNIKLDGFDFSNITYVPKEVHRPIYERCNPEKGDVLYIKDGATTGIAMVNNLDEEFSLLSSVALLKQDRKIMNGHFLCGVLNNNEMYSYIRSNMGGAAITRLTIAKLNAIRVIVPPMELQNQFADFVQQVDKSKVEVQESLNETQKLFDRLMQEYFG